MSEAIVELTGVRRAFSEGGRSREVLSGVDMTLRAGEWVALVGASGSGKTTLLSVIGGLDPQFEGSASVFGEGLYGLDDDARTDLRNRLVGFVFQSFHLLEHLSVAENVEVPLWLSREPLTQADIEERARAALKTVGLAGREATRVPSLSGGERQRVAIARALASRPRLILADEPTGNLDDGTSEAILELFDALRRPEEGEPGRALLFATHDHRVARRADRIIRLENGQLLEETK